MSVSWSVGRQPQPTITLEAGPPLVKDGLVVGSIGVSGMTSPEGGEVAAAGAAAL